MPLIDRVYSLGLLAVRGPSPPNAEKPQPQQPALKASSYDDSRSTMGGCSTTTNDEGLDSDCASVSAADSDCDCDDSDASGDSSGDGGDDDDDDDSDGDRVDSMLKSSSDPVMQGQAEICRRQSRWSGRFHELRHPAVDEDASDGFRLCGFNKGMRVYRLDSPCLKHLRRCIVRTAVGLCYIDMAAVCPPVVVVHGDGAGENGDGDGRDETAKEGPATPANALIPAAVVPPSDIRTVTVPVPVSVPTVAPTAPVKHINSCFAIRPSALGGLGAFALRDLARGEHILVERPLLRTDCFHLCAELERLPPAQRAEFYALSGHHPDARASAAERIWTANTFVAGALEGVFLLASRFNHTCAPRNNVSYRYDRRHDVLVMTTARRVEAGAELLISYGKTPAMLFQRFGFRCTCGACTGFSEEMAARYWDMRWG